LRLVPARILICGAARDSSGSSRPRTPVDFSSRPTIAIAPPSLRSVSCFEFNGPLGHSSSEFLRLLYPLTIARRRRERTCLDFSPSSRLHAPASTFPQGFPRPCVRCVPRFSQPLDAFLRTRACRPISSCCHVQDSSCSGCSPPAKPSLLVGESMPPCRYAVRAHRRSDVHPPSPRLRGFHPRESALLRAPVIHRRPRSLPSSGFSPPGHPFPSCTRFTRALRS